MNRLAAALLTLSLSALATPCAAQLSCPDAYSSGGANCAPVTASSGNVAAGVATATLAAVVGKVTYLCGFSITSAGSTAAAVVSPTVTNVITGTMTFTYASVAGVTLANPPLIVPFTPCLAAATPATTIPVSMPSLGAGNTNTTVNAWGYSR